MTDTDIHTDNDRQPAYVSYPSFEGFLTWYRDNGPAEISAVSISGYAKSASASQLIVALRSLGLVVDNVAQDHLGPAGGLRGRASPGTHGEPVTRCVRERLHQCARQHVS